MEIGFLFVLALVPAFIASLKGRSFGKWYLYGVLLFIVALIHSLLLPNVSEELKILKEGMVKCPYCRELVKRDALICKHCHSKLEILSNQEYGYQKKEAQEKYNTSSKKTNKNVLLLVIVILGIPFLVMVILGMIIAVR